MIAGFSTSLVSVTLGTEATFGGGDWAGTDGAWGGVDGAERAGTGGDSAGMAESVGAAGGGLFLMVRGADEGR